MEKKDFIVWTSKLEGLYKPSEETTKKLSQIDLYAIVGPTGVGKTTIMEKLGVPYVQSDVSRDKRPEEKNNKNYHFRSDYVEIITEIKNGDYVQFLIGNKAEFYGTRLSSYPEQGPCTMAVFAREVNKFQSLGFRKVVPLYIMPPSYVEWMRRIGGVRAKDLLSRISEARDSLLNAMNRDDFHYILNDNVEAAVADIRRVMKGEHLDEHREQLAVGTADILLERIGEDVLD